MSVSYEEMEAKRQEMVASFKEIASAMTRCVAIIEDYARLSPSTLTTTAALAAVENGALALGALEAVAGGKKQRVKKEKKPKDPNAPKRPPSAYLLFQNDVRESIRQANPGMPYKEILSVIANRWKDLSDSQRKVYEDAYNDATTQFRAADEAYKTLGVPATLAGVADSDEDDDTDATPPPAPKPAAVTPTPKKGDKKRKKDDAPVTPVVDAGADKKKAKKK
ncbi:Non-histone chromosomal protein 6 [Vanrija pseudolonga]|uniref:Non-histone chromosomal protein 6 n=1 Tax=Vanrija pseudolonga TaxID=143232 RepID=A0AAF1BN00_9TREE|nr:Non-histone chromosomal protein 6 [Vanrija pseudolonga]